MSGRRRTLAIVALGLLLLAGAAVLAWLNSGVATDPQTLMARLPVQNAVLAGLDFDALRDSGILRTLLGARASQEAEYVDFVRASGFDYQRDLHYLLMSFTPEGEFFLIRGNFDWPRLEQYVEQQKGSCFQHLCRMAGSTADKKISFLRLARNLMAMAVATDDSAAARMKNIGPRNDARVPKEPVWLTFSAGSLRRAATLQGASRLFASAIVDAERVTITAGLSAGDRLEARLEAVCRDPQQAGALTAQLQTLTAVLREVPAQQGKVLAQDSLAGLLASGTFSQAGSNVAGRWLIPRELLADLMR